MRPVGSHEEARPVKIVVAIIKPHRLDEVKEALRDIGVDGLTSTDVEGFGRQRGSHRGLSGRRVPGRLRSEGEDRGALRRRAGRGRRRRRHEGGSHGQDRRREDLGDAGRAGRSDPDRRDGPRRPVAMAEPTAVPSAERPAPVARLLDELGALDRAYSLGHHGRWSGARRAELVDACLRELFARRAARPGASRSSRSADTDAAMLSPGSDIDLLLVHDGPAPDRMVALVERLLYPLWDAGLRVSHALRTPEECRSVAAEHLDATTAMLDGRVLAGSTPVWDEALEPVVSDVRSDARAFADLAPRGRTRAARTPRPRLLAARARPEGRCRRAARRAGARVARGRLRRTAGGRRAAPRGRTAGRGGCGGVPDPRAQRPASGDRPPDAAAAARAPAARSPRRWASRTSPDSIAVDGLMRSVFEHARQLEHVGSVVFDRALRVTARDVRPSTPRPPGSSAAFTTVAGHGGVMPAAWLDAIDAAVELPERSSGPTTCATRSSRCFGPAPQATRALETLDRLGLLARYLPAWAAVRCRPQRDPYHRSSVDVHLLETFAHVSRLLEDPDDDPLAARAAEAVVDRDAVRFGALLHDIGKTGQGNHVPNGARIARETVDAMRLSAGDRRSRGLPRRRAPVALRHGHPPGPRGRRSGARGRRAGRHARPAGRPVPVDDRGRARHRPARLDAVARHVDPRARREGPARAGAGGGRDGDGGTPGRAVRGRSCRAARGGSLRRRAVRRPDAAGLPPRRPGRADHPALPVGGTPDRSRRRSARRPRRDRGRGPTTSRSWRRTGRACSR